MRVYRLQEKDNPTHGPWVQWPGALYTNAETVGEYMAAYGHPAIGVDVAGFGPEKLAHWFPVAHEDFAAEGYVVGEWEVPEDAVKMGRSGTQVAFRHNYAQLVATHCPTCIPTNGTF